jgi:hypothetical protein
MRGGRTKECEVKFNSRAMTNILLSWILAFLVYHFEREMFWNAVFSIVGIWLIVQAFLLPGKLKDSREKKKEEKRLNDEWFNVYQPAFEALRDKYDPKREWNEITNIPKAYRDELLTLNRKHQWMLKKRNDIDVD